MTCRLLTPLVCLYRQSRRQRVATTGGHMHWGGWVWSWLHWLQPSTRWLAVTSRLHVMRSESFSIHLYNQFVFFPFFFLLFKLCLQLRQRVEDGLLFKFHLLFIARDKERSMCSIEIFVRSYYFCPGKRSFKWRIVSLVTSLNERTLKWTKELLRRFIRSPQGRISLEFYGLINDYQADESARRKNSEIICQLNFFNMI